MVEVDRVSLEDVGRVGCCWVNILVDLAGVERRVVVTADGEGYGIGRMWLCSSPSAQQVLREGCLDVGVEVEASAPTAAPEGTATATPAARCGGVVVVVVAVGGRHVCV